MANQEQVEILKQGVQVWNRWRARNLGFQVDLFGAGLSGADLREANLSRADLRQADLWKADLWKADLSEADLSGASLMGASLSRAYLGGARLYGAHLFGADLSGADLREADLSGADLSGADLNETDLRGALLMGADLKRANLSGADLREADLRGTSLIRTLIDKAKISGSLVYAINVLDLKGEFEEQKDLIITASKTPIITVDNIKVAQFIHLILNNEEIRDVINTLTSKSVLILGRFSIPERKSILDALRNKLREYNLLPIVFDFDRPTDKDFTETINILARLSLFVIADITNPKSSPLELQATVPDYQIPFVPIIQEGEQPFARMVDLQKKYNWVMDTLYYDSIETLINALKPAIIDPAIEKHHELRLIKAQESKIRSAKDFLDKEKE
jgi:Pentapeptide repeats (8 copies)